MRKSIASLLGLCLAAPAFSPAADPQKPPAPASKRAEFIKKYDKNRDGKLDKAEWAEARKAHEAELLKRYDKNGNGKIDPEEREAPREDFRKQRQDPSQDPPPPPPEKKD